MRLDGLAIGAAYGRAAWRLWAKTPRAQPAAGWLEGVAAALATRPEALRVLQHPGIGSAERGEVVAALAMAVGGDGDLERFLALAVENGKIEHLGAIASAYRELADGAVGIHRGVLESARPLPPGRLEAFAAGLGESLGGEVVLESRVSPEIIGGFRLRLGREMADASVANGLQELGAALAGG